MRLDFWQGLGVVCTALLAAGTLLGLTHRWVVRPVWRTIRRMNQVADDLLGDRETGTPSLAQRVAESTAQSAATAAAVESQGMLVAQLANRLDEHLSWHARGGSANGNGPDPVPVRSPTRRR